MLPFKFSMMKAFGYSLCKSHQHWLTCDKQILCILDKVQIKCTSLKLVMLKKTDSIILSFVCTIADCPQAHLNWKIMNLQDGVRDVLAQWQSPEGKKPAVGMPPAYANWCYRNSVNVKYCWICKWMIHEILWNKGFCKYSHKWNGTSASRLIGSHLNHLKEIAE